MAKHVMMPRPPFSSANPLGPVGPVGDVGPRGIDLAMFSCQEPTFLAVDGFFADPDSVRRFALQQQFVAHPEYHKGKRTEQRWLWPHLRQRFEELLGLKITRWEEYDLNGVFQSCVAGDLPVFHSDEQTWAGAIYLTPDAPPESGTCLYRSRTTGGRTVAESVSLGTEPDEAERAMYHGKLLDPTAWETVDTVGNVYNRLALWNAHMVHGVPCYFGHDLQTSRLFQLFFFDAE